MAKKALLVGINDYKGVSDLGGCVNDVLDMHFSLRSLFNFQTPEIRVLTALARSVEKSRNRSLIIILKWFSKNIAHVWMTLKKRLNSNTIIIPS